MSADYHIFTRAKTAYEDTPLAKLTEAAMRGNAEMAAQAQAKDVASRQQDANDKTSVTLKGGRVTIKDADPSLIDGTQDKEVQDAYNAPHVAVASALSLQQGGSTAAAPPAGVDTSSIYDLVDKTVGHHVPRPTDNDIDEKLKTPDGIRELTLEIGGTRDHANRAIHEIARGQLSPQKIRETVQNWRAQNLSRIYSTSVKGPLDETEQIQQRAQMAAERHQAELDRQTTEARLRQSQVDAERKTAVARKQAVNQGIDYSMIEPGEGNANWHKAFDDANDSGQPASPEDYARIDRKAAQDVRKFYNDFFIAKKDVYQLGHFPTFEAAQSAYGHPFANKEEEARARNAWATAHEYDEQQSTKRDLQNQATAARMELQRERIANGTQTKLDDSAVALFGVDEILAMDPAKVKNLGEAITRKAALLNREVQSERDKLKGFQTKKADAEQRAHTSGGQAETANLAAEMQISMRKINEAQAGLAKINARKAGSAPTAAQPAKVPTFKQTGTVTLTNGQKIRAGTNDGKSFFDLRTGAPLQ